MSNRRAKAAATATVLGLGALGGVAMATNQGLPGQSGATTASVTTSASGAVTSQTAATGEGASTRAPIVTRASGGAGSVAPVDD
jgi:hypothetical protein